MNKKYKPVLPPVILGNPNNPVIRKNEKRNFECLKSLDRLDGICNRLRIVCNELHEIKADIETQTYYLRKANK